MPGNPLDTARETPAHETRESGGSAQARAVPCRNHTFDESLMCRCGTSWWAHQLEPRPCPHDARGRNRHSVTLAASAKRRPGTGGPRGH